MSKRTSKQKKRRMEKRAVRRAEEKSNPRAVVAQAPAASIRSFLLPTPINA